MSNDFFDHLSGILAVILFIWTTVLLWASWQIKAMLRVLVEERRELRRWKRLQGIYDKQREGWQ